jgi:hypothetical protein
MKRTLRAVLLATASLLLCACHHAVRIAQPPASAGWFLLAEQGSEPSGYRTYTYVFFTLRDFKDHSELKGETEQRNRALLQAITAPNPNASGTPANLFCIPVTLHATPAKVDLKDYDAQLAQAYRSLVQVQLFTGGGGHDAKLSALKLENNSGPFLVTSPAPLSQTRPKGAILFTELSDTAPGKIGDVIAAYRQFAAQGAADEPSSGAVDFANEVAQRLLNAHLAIVFAIRL